MGRRHFLADRASRFRPTATRCCGEFDAVFVGALGDPRVPDNRHARDILLGTRFELDLYVNYRPVRLLDERLCPLKDRTPADVELRRLPREHRGPLRRHRRPVQGRHRRRSRDPGRDQHLQGRAPDRPPRFRVREGERAAGGVHGRQEQRHDRRPRPVAAGVRGARCGVPGDRAAARLHRCARAVAGPGSLRSSRSSSPTTCSATSSRTSARRCRADWGWRRRAISIPAGRRCSSRCTARRRRSPGRTWPIRSARSCRRR